MTASSALKAPDDTDILAGLRVLLVEDEGLVALDAELILEDLGMEMIACCSSLEDGMRMARIAEIEVAMLDVNLRGKPSYPIAEVLDARGVPFIFTTGYDAMGWGKPAVTVAKPYRVETIRDAMVSIVAR